MKLNKFSMGIGDRFGHQGAAQLKAFVMARAKGVEITPVWNKSYREHQIIGSRPEAVRAAADAATQALGWTAAYFVDADHIHAQNADMFVAASDFFTLDVADYLKQPLPVGEVRDFVASHKHLARRLTLPGMDTTLELDVGLLEKLACKYLRAVREAGRLYRHIVAARGSDNFITEISMDETEQPQTPLELLVILAAVAVEKIPARTIAPKFTGRFNKGVDYEGDILQFEREFAGDVAAMGFAVQNFGLPADLKLSVHSGSDKFSIYAPIRRVLRRYDAGVHLKTAGTTWLEELAGLALAGGDGLELAREIYACAHGRFDELCQPYASVIAIDKARLPLPRQVAAWSGMAYAEALRHNPRNISFNPHFRQLLHVAYKVAAEKSAEFLPALRAERERIGELVTENIYEKHMKPLFF